MKPRKHDLISVERLRELAHYDRETGIFTRKVGAGPAKPGDRVGLTRKDGYREAKIGGYSHLEHVLVWLYVTGRYPAMYLDHRNRDRGDNRFSNLREVPRRALNHANSVGRRVGVPKGVKLIGNKWQARITVNGKSQNLGYFLTQEAAFEAYKVAAKKYFGEFACFDIREAP